MLLNYMEISRLMSLCLAALLSVIIFVNIFGYPNSSRKNNEHDSLKMRRRKRLPGVIIIGVKKCGTTTLGQFLDHHPSIAATGEISFFENYKSFIKGSNYYLRQMPYAR